jgi:hypothetical protein
MADGQKKVLVESGVKEKLHCSTLGEIRRRESNLQGENFRPLLQLFGLGSPRGTMQGPVPLLEL